MLIELLQIARNLAGQNIETGLVHKDFGTPGLSTLPTLKAVLNEEGDVVRILTISRDDALALWTLQSGNFKFFPAVRLMLTPALPIPIAMLGQKSVSLQDVTSLLQAAQTEPTRKFDTEVLEVSSKNRQRIRDWKNNADAETLNQLQKFSSAFDKFCSSPEIAVKKLLAGIESAIQLPCDEKTLATLANLLAGQNFVGKKQPKAGQKKIKENNRIQLCFDLKTDTDLSFTLYSPRVRQVVLECLGAEAVEPKENKSKDSKLVDGFCALSGRRIETATTLFPKWAATGVVNKALPIFSKNEDAPCNARYARVGIESFVVDDEAAKKVASALKAITDKPSGTNWCSLRNGKFEGTGKTKKESQDVLIVYPTMPMADLPLVNLFTKPEDSQDSGLKEFQDQARPVIKAFSETSISSQIQDYIVVLLIRVISSGQVQLAYSASQTRAEFVKAIDAWNQSADNLPSALHVPLLVRAKPDKAANKQTSADNTVGILRQARPKLLFPEQISRLLSYQWIRNGSETSAVEAPVVGQILDLFLRKSGVWQGIAANLLEVTLARTSVLLTHAGHVLHRDDPIALGNWITFSLQSKAWPDYAFSQTLSLIGSLLYAMNSHVKNYVEESAYQVGRLLAMMDVLHKCYGIAERGGDVPNSLIGNGLLGRAADSPVQALAELSERSRIFIGWAKSVDITDFSDNANKKNIAIHSARKVLRLVEPLAEQLHAAGSLDAEMSAVQKAHLFLGYLSPILGQEEE